MKSLHKVLITILLTSVFNWATDRLVENGVGWLWFALVIFSVALQVWLIHIPDDVEQ